MIGFIIMRNFIGLEGWVRVRFGLSGLLVLGNCRKIIAFVCFWRWGLVWNMAKRRFSWQGRCFLFA